VSMPGACESGSVSSSGNDQLTRRDASGQRRVVRGVRKDSSGPVTIGALLISIAAVYSTHSDGARPSRTVDVAERNMISVSPTAS